MFYVSIKKEVTEIAGAKFETLELANAWIVDCEAEKMWGQPTHTEVIPAVPAVLDEQENVIQEAIPARDIIHPGDYTIEVTDISEQHSYEKEIAKRVARINFGVQVFAEMATRNVTRLKAGTATLTELMQAEEKLSKVQRLMANSSTEIALQTLQGLDIAEIPSSEKSYFVGKIQAYLASE